ncbi:MAG: hypothetical protein ACT4PE_05560 [Candidatus Eiseniibacteriota bacterium]
MSVYDFNPPSDEELELLIGPPPNPNAQFEEQAFTANPVERILEGLARSAPRPPGPARNFGEGLAYGFVGGLQGEGAKVATARERFDRRQEARRLNFDEQRRVATEKHREKKYDVIREAFKEHRGAKEKEKKFELDNPMVADEDVKAFPGLERFRGRRISRDLYEEITSGKLERGQAVADRQAAAAERAAEAAERAARQEARRIQLDQVNNLEGLVTQYRLDKDVEGYRNTAAHYRAAQSAAAQKNGVGDHALVFAYMRSREPENPNAVREGEFDTASKAVGAMQNVFLKATLKRYLKGDILLPEGRRIILDTIREGMEANRQTFEIANAQYRRRASLIGIPDPESYFMRNPSTEVPGVFDRERGTLTPDAKARIHAQLDSLRSGAAASP